MAQPAEDQGTIDLLCQVYPKGIGYRLPFPREALRDEESLAAWPRPDVVKYLFKDLGLRVERSGDIEAVVSDLDRLGIAKAMVTVPESDVPALVEALGPWAHRFPLAVGVDVHQGMRAGRRLECLMGDYPQIKCCVVTPHFTYPTVPPSDAVYFPVYAKCIELDLPVSTYVGVPGPRVPSGMQNPMYLDEVCWRFPELSIVMKHGGEPWVAECIALMRKWPNLFYATSGFLPKHYPRSIIDFANSDGSDRVMYAGYFPLLDLDTILEQVAELPLSGEVRALYLGGNARRVFRIH